MRAVRVHELTGPKGLKVDELPDLVPDEGEVLIQVKAAGVNFADVLITYGKYQFRPEPPFVPGAELAGVVAAVGPNVTSLKPGDRVAANLVNGAFAEQAVVYEAAAVKLPDAVGFDVAAATLLTYGTSYHALVDRAALKPKETLLVLGAAGGVGVAAIQLGKALGARVIAAASTPAKLAFCREQGADEVIDYGSEDLKERIRALTDGEGADVIYDPIGGRYSEAALRAIAWQGRFLVIGFAAGDIPKIPINLLLLKGCSMVGIFWGQFAMREIDQNRRNLSHVLQWVAEGKLKPHVDAKIPFARATEALERLERREVRGKLLLTP